MSILEYYLKAMASGSFLFKAWVIDLFGVVELGQVPAGPYTLFSELDEEQLLHLPYRNPDDPDCFTVEEHPFQLFASEGKVGFIHRDSREFQELPALSLRFAKRIPLLRFNDGFDLPMGSVPNQTKAMNVSWGELLMNQTVKIYPFGTMFPLEEGTLNIRKFEDQIAPRVASVPLDGSPRDPNLIYGDVLEQKYFPAAFSISGLTMLAVPAATEFTIDVSPKMRALRKELLEKHKDELGNPVVVANIVNALVKADMEWQAQDPDKGFLQPGKAFDVVRAKTFLIHGLDYDFDDPTKVHLIERSLSEQWDPRDLKRYVNAIVDGSYNRGFDTALGGELAKILIRFFMTTKITAEDCGVYAGRVYTVTKDNVSDFIGCYQTDGKKDKLLSADDVHGLIGKAVVARTPLYCKAADGGFCVHCMGEEFRNRIGRLVASAMDIGSVIMYVNMSRNHGRALKTVMLEVDSLH